MCEFNRCPNEPLVFEPDGQVYDQAVRIIVACCTAGPPGFDDAVQQLTEYFSGSRKHFQLKYILNISPFYQKALKQVANVPYGQTSSYGDIAQKLNNTKAARAVGTANAKNPLPIIIPCHRIINSNGKLGGYAGGLNMKKYLLKLERNNR